MSIFNFLFKRKKPTSNRYSMIKELFLDYNTGIFTHVYSSDISIAGFNAYYKNISAYTHALDTIYYALKEDRLIYRMELNENIVRVLIYEFFLDNEGCYQNTVEVGNSFLFSINRLITLYEELEKGVDLSFNTEKNLNTIDFIISNVIDIVILLTDTLQAYETIQTNSKGYKIRKR